MLSIAIKNLLYFLYHGSREHTKFKSTNFYRIIKSFRFAKLENTPEQDETEHKPGGLKKRLKSL